MAGQTLALGLPALGTTIFSSHYPAPIGGSPPEGFNASMYTVDLLVPINLLDQRQPWDSHSPYQWLACILIAAGWILATTLIAGIIRELAREYREQFSYHEVQRLHPCSPISSAIVPHRRGL